MRRRITRLPWPVVSRLIDVWIWSERDRKILKEKMYNNTTFEVLAEKNHISVQQAKSIYYNSEKQLYGHIPEKYF